MKSSWKRFFRILLVIYIICLHGVLAILLLDRYLGNHYLINLVSTSAVKDPTAAEPIPTPLPVPSILADLPDPTANQNTNVSAETPVSPSSAGGLTVPVAGVRRDQLSDTFNDARSEGRTHDAIDIPAPQGTPVLAAADGTIAKFWDSEKGGISIYELGSDQRYFYYYAHLDRRADGLKEGDRVRAGQVIGYVGDTGNAGPGNYHLHFGISIVTDPKRYWGGTSINPYPLLRGEEPAPAQR